MTSRWPGSSGVSFRRAVDGFPSAHLRPVKFLQASRTRARPPSNPDSGSGTLRRHEVIRSGLLTRQARSCCEFSGTTESDPEETWRPR
jgi:hypothetical protein